MPVSKSFLVWLCATVASSAAAQQPRRSGPVPVISDSGVGQLRLGMSVEAVTARLVVLADTSLVNLDRVEMERVLLVRIGRDTVRAAITDEGRVDRIDIDTPHLQTRDGVRVGRSLRSLLSPRVRGGVSEATVGITLPGHCGLSLLLSAAPDNLEQGQELAFADLRRFPSRTRVARIEINGCQ
jgi:hypothetical protein